MAASFIFTRADIVLWDGGLSKGVPKRRRMRNNFQRKARLVVVGIWLDSRNASSITRTGLSWSC